MGVFFLSWALWEEMTFVLACCIVLVFAFGLIRLWWTNRRIRKLELVEAERRARLEQMRHCGVNPSSVTDIPFGIRAIQSGIEVKGIWISRSNTPVASRVASSTTLYRDSTTPPKGKGKSVDRSTDDNRSSYHTTSGSGSITNQTFSSSPQMRPTPGARYLTPLSADELDLNDGQPSQFSAYVDAYVPTGLHEDQHRGHARSSSAVSANRASLGSYVIGSAAHQKNSYIGPFLPDAMEPFVVDMNNARTHDIYGALPAPTWDQADGYSSSDAEGSSNSGQRRKSGYAKLQKKNPNRR